MLRRTLVLTLAVLAILGAMIVPQPSARAFWCPGVSTYEGNVCTCTYLLFENGRPIRVVTDC